MKSMTTATNDTASKAPRTRPADTCRLQVVIRGDAYTARPIRAETPDVIRAWRLRKADGTAYDVADTIEGATCDCADQTFRHEGRDADGCKHIRALRSLGLIDPDGEDASAWPAWTDANAWTVAR